MESPACAVVISRPGGREVLQVVNRIVRAPLAGEVRLRVRAAAVNPTDIGLRQHGPENIDPPWVPGMDAAGIVESVGARVERLAVGDAVMTVVTARRPDGGAQSELLVVPQASVVPLPTGASFEEGSTLLMNGLTAMRGLEMLGLAEGQTLAFSGGAGLIASYAIPLAKQRGLHVVADAGPADEALVASFGADIVLPRGDTYPTLVREAFPGGVDGFFDTALIFARAFPAIRDGGALAIVRDWRGGGTERGIALHRVVMMTVIEQTEWLQQLRELASNGILRLRVAGTYEVDRVAEAHRVMEGGGVRGRLVLTF